VVQGYRCIGVLQGYGSSTGVQLDRSVMVYRDTCVLRGYRCTGEVQLCNGYRRSTGDQGSRSSTGVVPC